MEILQPKIVELTNADYNPRQISEKEREALARNLNRYGFVEPIVINNHKCPKCGDRRGVIIGGHQRVSVAKDLGMNEVPATAVNLHIREEKLLNLALNKNGGAFDTVKLKKLVGKINEETPAELDLTGLDEDELENLLRPIEIDFDLAFAKIPDAEETEEGQMTFNLSRKQYRRVVEAMEKAQATFKTPTGKNEHETWGFALLKLCQNYGNQTQENK